MAPPLRATWQRGWASTLTRRHPTDALRDCDNGRVTTRQAGPRTWRVRTWIRVGAGVVLAFLLAQQVDVIRRVRLDEMPATEIRDGWVFIASFIVVIWLVAFRPRVTLNANRSLLIQNPLRRWVDDADQVREVYFGRWGLIFELNDGRKPWSIIFQDTAGGTEPRWFDVAEAVTGVRPQPIEEYDEEEL